MISLLTSKHCEVKVCQSLMFDFEVWCSTSKFDFEVEVWLCWIFEWKFKVDFEKVWSWGLKFKVNIEVYNESVKLKCETEVLGSSWY